MPKPCLATLLTILTLLAAGCATTKTPATQSANPDRVTLHMTPAGTVSLQTDGHELISDGNLQILLCSLQKPDDSSYTADLANPKISADPASARITHAYPWGSVTARYQPTGDRVQLTIDITNTSPDTIAALQLRLLEIRFPQATTPRNPAFRTPWMVLKTATALAPTLGEPGLVVADYGTGSLALCNEDVTRPLALGFPPATDGPALQTYPLLVYTGRHPAAAKTYPFINRPIPPGGTDQYHLSLRFAPAGTPPENLADDLYQRFAQAYPYELQWPDRRPIGRIFLCRSFSGWKTNPRGWFNDEKVDVTTPEGLQKFHQRFLAYADTCIKIMKNMDAQGVIVWDIEGQENNHPISYLGDPRSLPPELDGVIDPFMKRFTDAGFRVGITIRPQVPVRRPYNDTVFQAGSPDPIGNMSNKIAFAKKRWGCSIFYLDSNVYGSPDPRLAGLEPADNPLVLNAWSLQRVAAAHRDVLIIPEIEDVRMYAYGAPYIQLNYDKISGPPADVRKAYPQAFGVIVVGDSDLDQRWPEVVAGVKRGDILFFNTWFTDSWNEKIKKLYQDAKK